jgi:hypothetical protein
MHDIVHKAASESASMSESLLISPSSSISKCNAGEIVASQRKRKVGMIVEKRAKKRAMEGKNTACISHDGKFGDKPDSIMNKQMTNESEHQ